MFDDFVVVSQFCVFGDVFFVLDILGKSISSPHLLTSDFIGLYFMSILLNCFAEILVMWYSYNTYILLFRFLYFVINTWQVAYYKELPFTYACITGIVFITLLHYSKSNTLFQNSNIQYVALAQRMLCKEYIHKFGIYVTNSVFKAMSTKM